MASTYSQAVTRNSSRLLNSSARISFAVNSDSSDSREQPLILRSGEIPDSVSSRMNLAGSQETNGTTDTALNSEVESKQAETKAESLNEAADPVLGDLLDQGFETT